MVSVLRKQGQVSHYQQAEAVFRNEIQALERVLVSIAPSFDQAVSLIRSSAGKVVLTGVGKSGIVAHKIAATFASTGTQAVFLNAAEGLHGDLGVVGRGDVVLMLSNSGKTSELCRLVPSIQKIGASMMGIFGNTRSRLAQSCDCVLDAGIESEACPLGVAPMASSTVAMVIGDALAASLMMARGFTREDFVVFHPGGALGRRLLFKVEEVMLRGDQMPMVRPECLLKEAIVEMDRCNIGVVIATNEAGRIAGLLSEGDIRRFIVRGVSLDVSLAEVMTRTPIVIHPGATLEEALNHMEKSDRKVYVIPVVDSSGFLQGVLRMHDVVSG